MNASWNPRRVGGTRRRFAFLLLPLCDNDHVLLSCLSGELKRIQLKSRENASETVSRPPLLSSQALDLQTAITSSPEMLAAASSFLTRSALNTNYTIHNPAQPGSFAAATQETLARAREAAERAASSPAFGRSAAASPLPALAPGSEVTPFSVGLWKIVRATNKTTHKVSELAVASEGREGREASSLLVGPVLTSFIILCLLSPTLPRVVSLLVARWNRLSRSGFSKRSLWIRSRTGRSRCWPF